MPIAPIGGQKPQAPRRPFALATDQAGLQKQLAHARANATGGGARWNQRISKIQGALGNTPGNITTPTPGNPVTQPAAPVTEPIAGNGQPVNTMPVNQPEPVTFRGMQDFLPKTIEDDPVYQYQTQRGMKDIERKLAARGLTGSGFEFQTYDDFLNQAGAAASQRLDERAQFDATRFDQFGRDQFGQNRLTSNDAWDRLYKTTDLALSQNPLQWTTPMTRDASQRIDQFGRRVGAQKRDQYGRVIGGGGGGGGAPAPQFVPPAQPFQTPYGDILGSMGGGALGSDIASTLIGGLGQYYSRNNQQQNRGY